MSEKLSGQFDAWLRGGAKDLYNGVVPAFPQSIHSIDEPGTPLNPTPQMVTNDLGEGNYSEYLRSRAEEVPSRQREPPDAAMER